MGGRPRARHARPRHRRHHRRCRGGRHRGPASSVASTRPTSVTRRPPPGCPRAGVRRLARAARVAVTAVADVVLPVASQSEKSGTYVNWEGRVRAFEEALESNAVSDHRALDMLAGEMGVFLETRTAARDPRPVRGPRAVERETAPRAPREASAPPRRRWAPATSSCPPGPRCSTPAACRTASRSWPAPRPLAVARLSAASATELGVADGDAVTVTGPAGSVTLPAVVTEGMVDGVVWLPTNARTARPRRARCRQRRARLGRPPERTPSRRVLRHEPQLTAYGIVAALPTTDNPVADFSDTPWWLALIKAVVVFVYLLLSTLLVIWFERRVIGRMQQRPGPNRNGPFGLLQTLADGMKSMLKEDITPRPGRQARLHPRAAHRRDDGVRLLRDHPARRHGVDVRPRDAAAGHRRAGRRPARARRRRRRRLRHHPRRLELRLDLPAARRAALDRAGHLLRDRHGPLARRDLPLQRVDVDVADRVGAELPLVHPAGVLLLRRLRRHHGRRDEPSALRPRRGRGRADRWLPHRVLLDELRDVLPR